MAEAWGYTSMAFARIEWSQEYVLEGGSGTGFIQPQFFIHPPCCGGDPVGSLDIVVAGTEYTYCFPSCSPPPAAIAVQFGVPFTISVSAFGGCDFEDDVGCGGAEMYLSALNLTDAKGNVLAPIVLSGTDFLPVPEPAGVALLGTAVLAFYRKMKCQPSARWTAMKST
jgi:hypothetical protein